MAAWIYRIASHVKYTSLKVYCAAVRYQQVLEGYPWDLEGNEIIHRAKRWVRRHLPCSAKGAKFPITFAVLRKILPRLPSWPVLEKMSHTDRLFAAASIHAVAAFLRGGEFLVSPGGCRPILRMSNVSVRTVSGADTTVLMIPQPKARWWLSTVEVPCFDIDGGGAFSPPRLWRALVTGSPAVAGARASGSPTSALPAFHFEDGSPLSRSWMMARTSKLCASAGMGCPENLKMASWRAGAVRSATDANLGDSLIMELGRWKSNAWLHYLLHTPVDVQGAARAMWQALSPGHASGDVESLGSVSDGDVLHGACTVIASSWPKPHLARSLTASELADVHKAACLAVGISPSVPS